MKPVEDLFNKQTKEYFFYEWKCICMIVITEKVGEKYKWSELKNK